ncbi:protein C2-DOMAIN ABA-RELATED 10 [Cucumis melo var. makuwa]|uniref:Protein C2-DOMAIN ABA-RELATED 10 n=1 Tax=Cucumis melo var. makuwa TaxID=1194695 RepID=A0A5D3DA33_CUCMM|nr:protein C2-DOMAIN ABA-RELATED 10 [Cucumis melo var. makuwa]TYK20374.1 protein C2-DOMAIN ABA-RELATED 10 [Cucumis melo var. makuwa]
MSNINRNGLLRIRLLRGHNLAIRDAPTRSSDPYVVITCANQKFKSRVVKRNCNPEWNEEFTFSLTDINTPIKLAVFDRDRFTKDDGMGDAEIDIKPYIECLNMGLENLPNGCVVKRVQPSRSNSLADESPCVWNDGKITQDMTLRLQNVECGEIMIQLSGTRSGTRRMESFGEDICRLISGGDGECCSEDDGAQSDNHSQCALFIHGIHHRVQSE